MKPQTFFPNSLEVLRAKQGLTRFHVAVQLATLGHSVTDDTIGRWERGETMPGADDLAWLAKVYHVTVEDFYR